MPPKKGNSGPNKGKNKPKNNNKSDSDDDWVPTDVFGNPMPIVDTSGWDEVKTFDQAKKTGNLLAKSDQKRQQRQQQQSKADKEKQQQRQEKQQQQQATNQSSQPRRQQQHNESDDDDNNNKSNHKLNNSYQGSLYHDHDGTTMISQRARSRSRSQSRPKQQQQQQSQQQSYQQKNRHQSSTTNPKKLLDHPHAMKPPKVFKPTSITLTSFENKDRTTIDAAVGSKPTTVRTIFAKMTQEEKDEQRKLTLLQLPTYSTINGQFLPEHINTLTPGYIPGHSQPTTPTTTSTALTTTTHSMPISPLYQQFHISFPHRPNIPNPRALTPQQYRDIEEKTFHKWLEAIYTQFQPSQLNHFEHNLYVWKQLWLCCESSDIILIIIDVRNPLFHFNSHLYHYIVHELKKPFVLVLNKIDLIPISISLGFKRYLEKTFPGVHAVLFSSYPSTLHSLVLSLQHYQYQNDIPQQINTTTTNDDNNDDNTNITMDALLKHDIDLTPADIANHQRTVVNRMKMANIIDTVGVDELLQLCLHLTKGHGYKSQSDIYNEIQTNSIKEQQVQQNNKNDKKITNNNDDNNNPELLNQDDIHNRRILSQREQLKWEAKQNKNKFKQDILKSHLKDFITHAEKRANEIKAYEEEQKHLQQENNNNNNDSNNTSTLESEMEELTLNRTTSTPNLNTNMINTNTTKSRFNSTTSYFKDDDALDDYDEYKQHQDDDDDDNDDDNDDEHNNHSGSDGDDDNDNDENEDNKINKHKVYSMGRDNNNHQFSIESKVNRLHPPQINAKKNKKHQHHYSEDDNEDEDNDEDNDDENDDEDDSIDYDHIELYMPELSMTEDDIDRRELSHIVQDSPILTSSRQHSPAISASTSTSNLSHKNKAPIKPVFDLQRVLNHIYTQEENSRETHNKTKESLRKFQSSQHEIGQYYSDSDDNIDEKEKERKKHQKPQQLTKAQLREQEKQHLDYVKKNRIKIGFVGHPNVGKSSVVNAISRKKTVSVSRQPGHTKYNQTIKINELITLIDCPGLIFPALDNNKISSTLFGLYPIPQVSLPIVVIYYLAQMIDLVNILGLHNYHPLRYEQQDIDDDNNGNKINTSTTIEQDIKTADDLLNMKLPNQGRTITSQTTTTTANNDNDESTTTTDIGYGWTANTICEAFAIKRGFMTAKASPDPQRAAQQILYLIADGKIQLYMLPPE